MAGSVTRAASASVPQLLSSAATAAKLADVVGQPVPTASTVSVNCEPHVSTRRLPPTRYALRSMRKTSLGVGPLKALPAIVDDQPRTLLADDADSDPDSAVSVVSALTGAPQKGVCDGVPDGVRDDVGDRVCDAVALTEPVPLGVPLGLGVPVVVALSELPCDAVGVPVGVVVPDVVGVPLGVAVLVADAVRVRDGVGGV